MPSQRPPRKGKTGRWHIDIVFQHRSRRKSISIAAPNKALVRREAAACIAAWEAGQYDPWQHPWPGAGRLQPPETQTSVAESLRQYRDAATPEWSARTRANMHYLITALQQHFPRRPMASLTAEELGQFITHRQPALAPSTARGYIGRINTWLRYAHQNGHLPRPLRCPALPKTHTASPTRLIYITPEELRTVQRAIIKEARQALRRPHVGPRQTHLWLVAFLPFCFYTGLRRQEALDLRRHDIDLETGLLHIRNTKAQRAETLPIGGNQPLQRIINAQLRRRPNRPDARLFGHAGGDRISKTFKRYLRAALPPERAEALHFHSIRHGTATYLLQHLSIAEVKDYMRHRDIRTTLGYAKIIQKQLGKHAAQAWNQLPKP